jgi:hypothetical protein
VTLVEQQQRMVAALFDWPAQDAIEKIAACAMDTGARGLKAYQSNGHALAERALRAAYPVIAELLGEESFPDLARALWHAHPPLKGDMGLWGGALDGFLESSAQVADEPYLADVARCEWAMHRCSTQADVVFNAESLQLLTEEDPEYVSLVLAPGCAMVQSFWPVVSILAAHREGIPTLAQAGELLRLQVPQSAVIWRDGLRPCVREAWAGELDLIEILQGGRSLAEGLDSAPALQFDQWFPMAIQSGLVMGAKMLQKVVKPT